MYWEKNLSQLHFVHHSITLITVVPYKGLRGDWLPQLQKHHELLNNCYGRFDSLQDGRFGDGIPGRARFCPPVQTGRGAHPASCTMGNLSFFSRVKWPGCDAEYPPPSSAEIKKRVELYLYIYLLCTVT